MTVEPQTTSRQGCVVEARVKADVIKYGQPGVAFACVKRPQAIGSVFIKASKLLFKMKEVDSNTGEVYEEEAEEEYPLDELEVSRGVRLLDWKLKGRRRHRARNSKSVKTQMSLRDQFILRERESTLSALNPKSLISFPRLFPSTVGVDERLLQGDRRGRFPSHMGGHDGGQRSD